MNEFRAEAGSFVVKHGDETLYTCAVAEHRSPLRRPGTTYEERLQLGKESNVTLVAKVISGTLLEPGQEFSYHHCVGPPTKKRGFVMGAELHDGRLEGGIGGGACQVSNLLYVLALISGCTITERHRHGFDLFPDSERTVPFGCGATVFFPTTDLRFRNSLDQDLFLSLTIEDGFLVGRTFSQKPVSTRWRLVESEGSIVREADRWIRRNIVVRIASMEGVDAPAETIAENVAVCLYDPEPKS